MTAGGRPGASGSESSAEVHSPGDIVVGTAKTWYAATGVVGGFFILYFLLARCLRLGQLWTFNVLEQQRDVSTVKDTVRNIWTNITLIGALLLTIAFVLITDSMMPKFSATIPGLVAAFESVTVLGTLGFAEVTLECILHLIYTEALTPSGTIRYLIQFRSSIGGPMMVFVLAVLNLLCAFSFWALAVYGLPVFVTGWTICVITGCVLFSVLIPASYFSPVPEDKGAAGWIWVQSLEHSDSDSHSKTGLGSGSSSASCPWWDFLLRGSCSKKQLTTLQERAKAAALLEAKEASAMDGQERSLHAGLTSFMG